MKKKFDTKMLWALVDEEVPGYKIVHKGEWVSEGKCEYQEVVFLEEGSGKHFEFTSDRSGSYFTEYYFGLRESNEAETECTEVELREIKVRKWVPVGGQK